MAVSKMWSKVKPLTIFPPLFCIMFKSLTNALFLDCNNPTSFCKRKRSSAGLSFAGGGGKASSSTVDGFLLFTYATRSFVSLIFSLPRANNSAISVEPPLGVACTKNLSLHASKSAGTSRCACIITVTVRLAPGSTIPVFGLTQYFFGAVVFTLNACFSLVVFFNTSSLGICFRSSTVRDDEKKTRALRQSIRSFTSRKTSHHVTHDHRSMRLTTARTSTNALRRPATASRELAIFLIQTRLRESIRPPRARASTRAETHATRARTRAREYVHAKGSSPLGVTVSESTMFMCICLTELARAQTIASVEIATTTRSYARGIATVRSRECLTRVCRRFEPACAVDGESDDARE